MTKKTTEKKTRQRRKPEETFIDFIEPTNHQKGKGELSKLINFSQPLKCKNKTQKDLITSIKLNDVTICAGPAGTGKTYLSCYEALELLKNDKNIQKIVLIKSITTLKSEEIGYLKGDLMEKMEPFVYSFTNNFKKIIGDFAYQTLMYNSQIEVLPIAYLRGVNIDNAIIIVDEVQNITKDNMKTILTRLGSFSKLILLGDKNQIDIKDKRTSSLTYLVDKIQKNKNESVGLVEFTEEDIIRHKLTKYFIDLFEDESDSTVHQEKNNDFIKIKKNKPTINQKPKKNLFKTLINKFFPSLF